MITKENIVILLGFILGTLIAAGIIFFIVIGFSMMLGAIPSNPSHNTYDEGITGPGEGVSGLYDTYNWNQTFYNNTLAPTGANSTTSNITTYTYAAGGGGGCPESGCPPPTDWTVVEENVKTLGENCTFGDCGWWVGYETSGFYNLTGVYYDNGTPTGMTLNLMEKLEEINAKYRYGKFMAEHGVLV